MKRHNLAALAVALHILSPLVAATPIVIPASLPGWNISIQGSNVTIVGPTTGAPPSESFTITTALPGDPIGEINVHVRQASTIVSLTIDGHDGQGVDSVRSVVRHPNSNGELWIDRMYVARDIGVGNRVALTREGIVEVNRIENLMSAGRNIYADVRILASPLTLSGQAAIKKLEVRGQNLQYHQDGCLFGDVVVNSTRKIEFIHVYNCIGSLNNLTPNNISALGQIDRIWAGSYSKVNISVPNGPLGELIATDYGWGGDDTFPLTLASDPAPTTPTGTLTPGGALNALRLETFNLATNLDSVITVAQAPSAGLNGVWRIGRSLRPAARINLPANGLPHQIIINQTASLTDAGVWAPGATVHVDGYTLNDGYSTIPSFLGGGAVGRASYVQHGPASLPPPNSVYYDGYIDPEDWRDPAPCQYGFTQAKIEFYGPVLLADGVLPSEVVRVERSPILANPLFENVSHLFSAGVLGRELRIGRNAPPPQTSMPWERNYIYRVTVLPQRVVSSLRAAAGQTLTNPFVDSFSVVFAIIDGCGQIYDIDLNGVIDANDIPAWATNPSDLNNSGAADDVDWRALIYGVTTWPNPQ